MGTMKIYDMTLRVADSVKGASLTFKEKLEVARCLDRLKVDGIELPPLYDDKAEVLCNKTIASLVGQVVSAGVEVTADNVEATWESIRAAKHPQLNVIAPVSTVQMEYSFHKKAPAMLEAVAKQVKACRFFCENVEFTAEDATRAEMEFLCQIVEAAIAAGASKITLCDSAGLMMPEEMKVFVEKVKEGAPSLQDAELFVQLKDEMDMATACLAAAMTAGAAGVKCTAVYDEYPSLEKVSRFLQLRGADLSLSTDLRTTELTRAVGQLRRLLTPQVETESVMSSLGVGNDIPTVCLDKGDDINEVIKVVHQLGYDLTEEDNAKVYEAFLRVANKKHFVGTKELDTIVASTALQVPQSYHLESYVINSGNVITATANILLDKNGEKMRGVGLGDGPIDAAFLAIEQIVGHKYELDDFQIQTVTEGRDAMGSALVKLRAGGRVYSGTGISTDIIGASIRAYLSALNKILYTES